MRRYLPAIALALILPGIAHADWGWTNWTMSAEEVAGRSDGTVRRVEGGLGDQVNGWDLRAEGRTRQDGIGFAAQFYFDPAGRTLHVVRLTPAPQDCPKLVRLLTDRYGPARDEGLTLTGNPGVTFTAFKWRDAKHGDFIAYSANTKFGELAPGCFVRYRPLAEPDPPS